MRTKKCKICKQVFQPTRPIQPCCGYECEVIHANNLANSSKTNRERLRRKETKEAKERIKTRSQWLKEAQIAFNAYIRKRDRHQLCICCDQSLTLEAVGGGFDCGHYRSVGSAPHLRFDERNAHGQRKQCNRWGSGRAVDYRMGLIKRIGLAEVEKLESDQAVKKYTIDELKAIKSLYKLKIKELENECMAAN